MTATATVSEEKQATPLEMQHEAVSSTPAAVEDLGPSSSEPQQDRVVDSSNDATVIQSHPSELPPTYTKSEEPVIQQALTPQQRAQMDYERIMGQQRAGGASPALINSQTAYPEGATPEQRAQIDRQRAMNAPVPWYTLKDNPKYTKCPRCNADVLTTTQMESGNTVVWTALCLCCFTGILCAWIPFVVDSMKDTQHRCPSCRNLICTMSAGGNFKPGPGLVVPATAPKR